MSKECKKPVRVHVDALVQAAHDGVTRAIEARREAGVELSGAEVNEVSGALLPRTIIAGGITPFPVYPPVMPGQGFGGITIV
jgi:hypothetical protein